MNFGFIYVYSTMVCHMEVMSRRRSLLHNVLAGGTIGFVGVTQGLLGIPFYYQLSRFRLSPPVAGAVAYGGIGGVMGIISGKHL
eukprot:g2597.t1